MDFEVLVNQLQTGGPWALVALLVLALAWLARAYVRVRDLHDAYQDKLLAQMKDILTESTTASVRQAESNVRQAESNERVARALEVMQNVRS